MKILRILWPLGVFVAFIACNTATKKQKGNNVKFDEKAGEQILYGKITRTGFQAPGMKSWYQEQYKTYQVDKQSLKAVSQDVVKEIRIDIILGTWCPDSRREVPRFIKIADYLNIPEENISMLGVDRGFNAPGFRKGQNGITRVPTFVIKHNGKEIGRIVERPKQSLENDLAAIVAGIAG